MMRIGGASLEQPSAGRAAARRRFSVPLLTDVVSVSSVESIDSNGNPNHR
jgi:hypothetical protein